ncbi:MAG TPA: ABC transporter ATP-binding protein [Methanocorpusculum sp.]|nr:ABC transporter ATP-binding protein [Methanocorpusculum sp.]HJK80974.1 ABC transporter ATP-binding protein [Methanocorpusculum sp.]
MRELLAATHLTVSFGAVRAVRDVSLLLHAGETVAVVGESGCGKSVVAQSVMRLLPEESEVTGTVTFCGKSILHAPEKEMEQLRGTEMAMVFQSPERSLNPVLTIEKQLTEPQILHGLCDREEARIRAAEILGKLGLEPERILPAYPWMCSGGMCQRILFAAVMLLHPKLVIADEPTKGLDADLIGGLAQMLADIPKNGDTGLMLITHDIGLAGRLADRLLVMYGGMIVEEGKTADILEHPCHPYTRGLLASLPENGFHPIPGISPALSDLPCGCVFHPRCCSADEMCRVSVPPLRETGDRRVRCLRC